MHAKKALAHLAFLHILICKGSPAAIGPDRRDICSLGRQALFLNEPSHKTLTSVCYALHLHDMN